MYRVHCCRGYDHANIFAVVYAYSSGAVAQSDNSVHKIAIFPVALLIFWLPLKSTALVAIGGLALLLLNLSWMSLVLSEFCARYRDVPQIISNLLQVAFYLTPIIWMPQLLSKRVSIILLDANPFFHLIEIVGAPLFGTFPSTLNWRISILLALAGWSFRILFYGRFRMRIAYWL